MTDETAVRNQSSIAKDLQVIHRLVEAQPVVARRARSPWWGAPSSEAALELLEAEYGALPDDVKDFYRTTDVATFGPFDEILPPETLVRLRDRLSQDFSAASIEQVPEIYEKNRPSGRALLPMSGSLGAGCLIELGGPKHGRVIFPPRSGDFWRTLAWSLADAVACIRELYEMGWYDWDPFGPTGDPHVDPNKKLERLRPVLDRWNCNPVIACFEDHLGYEPERPPDR